MNIAIIGCGFVADGYGKTLGNYPELKLVGAFDRNPTNMQSFLRQWPARAYKNFDELLGDISVEMVLNLTNPRSHFEVTKRCLEAGKHVYSEKPLAMDVPAAQALAKLACQKGLKLACAPCSLLSESAQTLAQALRQGVIGKVRLVYAEFDDGMIAPQMSPWSWQNSFGVNWPAKDEFEVGCTYEHAGYVLTWLGAFFGPAKRVTAFASCQIPDKGITVENMAPDFTVGCIEFREGIVARVTCGLVAPKKKSITIIGDKGILSVDDVRNDVCPVYLQSTPSSGKRAGVERRINRLRKMLRLPGAETDWNFRSKLPLIAKARGQFVDGRKPVDFCRGPAELAAAVREKRPCRLSTEFAIHIVEIIEVLQYPERFGYQRQLTSNFDPIEPVLSQV